jgi:hypothetical protein
MDHPPLFPWFGSKWLLAISKHKVCLRMIISAYWRHPKQCDTGTESNCTTGVPEVFPTVAALG